MRSTSTVVALALASSVGCAEEGGPPRARAPVSGTDPSWPAAVHDPAWNETLTKISDATCDREQSCGTIGPGGFFKSREECVATVRAKIERGVTPGQCPGGVDRDAFKRCLDSLEAGQCDRPGDAITRAARCDAADLCIR